MNNQSFLRNKLENLIETVKPGHFVYTYPPHKVYPKIEEKINPLESWKEAPEKDLNVYIHIPFCKQKCSYCNIESIVVKEGSDIVDTYLDCLEKEIDMYKDVLQDFNPVTVYVGGGTPTFLDAKQLERLFLTINSRISDTKSLNELCIELAPDTMTAEKLDIMKKYGVTRVSIGMQSLDDSQLEKMNRKYPTETPINIFKNLRNSEFKNINVDVIYGHPDQTLDMLKETLKDVLELRPAAISVYPLNVKPLTRFWKELGSDAVDRDKIDKMYDFFKPLLLNNGYTQDTRLRFVLDGVGRYEHKDQTIKGKPVKGFGAAAQSYSEKLHYRPSYSVTHCKKDIFEYIDDMQNNKHPARYAFELSDEERMRRYIIMNIRHSQFNTKAFKDKFGIYPEEFLPDEFNLLYKDGYISKTNDVINLTDKGFKRANAVSKFFFSEDVLRMQGEYVYE